MSFEGLSDRIWIAGLFRGLLNGVRDGVESVAEFVDDFRDTVRLSNLTDSRELQSGRLIRRHLRGLPADNDPLVSSMMAKDPFRIIRRRNLPLLASRTDLQFPEKLPTLVIDLDDLLAKVSYDVCLVGYFRIFFSDDLAGGYLSGLTRRNYSEMSC